MYVDKSLGVLCDQIIKLNNFYPSKFYPGKLRRIKFYDKETELKLDFVTNNFELTALEIAKLYKYRWRIELFFKWIKQIECTATPSFTAPTATDACNGATVNNLGDATSVNGCTTTITRSWDATDVCGNHSATVSQAITIVDTTPPTIGAAGAPATIECTATPSFTAPTASDACNGATVNILGDATSVNGCTTTITRSWDATDVCGNHSATVSQAITIVDTTPPTIGAAGAPAT